MQLYHGQAMSLEKYRTGMLNGHRWAHSSEIEAATDLFKCKISVYLKGYRHNQFTYSLVLLNSMQIMGIQSISNLVQRLFQPILITLMQGLLKL